MARHALGVALMVVSLGSAAWAVAAEDLQMLFATALSGLGAAASLAYFLLYLDGLVTRFELVGDRLSFKRLARFTRSIDLANVWSVTTTGDIEPTSVVLGDGSTLLLAVAMLENGDELVDVLRTHVPAPGPVLEGRFSRSAVTAARIEQAVICVLLAPVSALGVASIFLSFHHLRAPGQWVFLPLGIVLILLAATVLRRRTEVAWLRKLVPLRRDEPALPNRIVAERAAAIGGRGLACRALSTRLIQRPQRAGANHPLLHRRKGAARFRTAHSCGTVG